MHALKTSLISPRFRRSTTSGTPLIFLLVLFFTFVANNLNGQLIGFNASGLAWSIPLLFALAVLGKRPGKITFPVGAWIPWIFLLAIYLATSDSATLDDRVSPLQRTIQVLAPLFVGMAASTYRPTSETLDRCVVSLRGFAYVLFASLILGSLATILARGTTGLAAQVMTCMLLGIFFIVRYFLLRQRRDLVVYVMMAVMPVLAITRMVTAITLLLPPLSFSTMKLRERVILVGLVAAIGVAIFQLPQIQKKMFFSGEGKISDISLGNPDFATSGRSAMWDALFTEANNSPWFGHGTGAGETMTYQIFPVGYPHNDWLLTYFDYGILGVVVFLLSNIYMLVKCLRSARRTQSQNTKVFFLAGASTFLPFMAVMFTDNIMVYASYFGVLQYTLIGLAYGALGLERRNTKASRVARYERA